MNPIPDILDDIINSDEHSFYVLLSVKLLVIEYIVISSMCYLLICFHVLDFTVNLFAQFVHMKFTIHKKYKYYKPAMKKNFKPDCYFTPIY